MTKGLTRAFTLGVVGSVTAISALAAAPSSSAVAPGDPPVVKTTRGPVQGVTAAGLHVFRAIPYAAPPVGELRFRPPSVPKPWSQPLRATEFGPACVQKYDEMEVKEGGRISEDCLTLNVWSGSLNGPANPVIVFIHGGGFTSGAASNPWYDGAGLARRGVTVVSIQYRVGPFGWLDMSGLGPQYARSMNNGLLDQMMALRWVRDNIAAFGGDPHNVTVTGESAGAISIAALMGIPAADDLYDRAILQSGTAGTVATRQWAADVADKFTELAGVDSREGILGLSTEQVLATAGKLYESQFSDTAFHPVVDGDLLPRLPAERIASSDGPAKPVVIGTTLDEARYWLYYIPELLRLPRSYWQPWLESLVGDRAGETVDAYRKQRPGLTDGQIGVAIAGDVGFRMPAIRMAEAFAARGVDTRMYLATVPSIAFDGALGSPHAVELPFVFGTTAAASTFVADSDANRALSDQVQNLWVSFARGGHVGSATTPWPLYDTKNRSTLVLDTNLRVENDPYPETRKVWGDMAFDGAHPGLDRITPLQFEGTNAYDLRVIAAVVGWGWIAGGGAALLVIIAAVVGLLAHRWRKRLAAGQ